MNFVRLSPAQMARALEMAKQENASLRLQLEAAQKDRDTFAARCAELANAIASDEGADHSRDAIPPPPLAAADALDIIVFEDDVREVLEFYAGGGQDFGNRAAKVIIDARRRAEVAAAPESETP